MAVAMPPFAMVVRVDGVQPEPCRTWSTGSVGRLRVHLRRRPTDNPVLRLGQRMTDDLPAIAAGGMDAFHRYAFGSCRHLGANGELAATFVDWLGRARHGRRPPGPGRGGGRYRTVSTGAKAAEFTLARSAAGRKVDLDAVIRPLAVAWERATTILADRYST